MTPSKKIAIMKRLLERLNGKCSKKESTCPQEIERFLFEKKKSERTEWSREQCIKDFFWLNPEHLVTEGFCPCHIAPYELLEAPIY